MVFISLMTHIIQNENERQSRIQRLRNNEKLNQNKNLKQKTKNHISSIQATIINLP